ncbi:MAG: hypothetical protein ACRCWO_00210 [Bosea sp. (in: a-proteobacteria)]
MPIIRQATSWALAAMALCLCSLAALAQPMQLPGAQAPSSAGTQQAPATSAAPARSGNTGEPRKRAEAPVVAAGTEEKLVGSALKRNGALGEATLMKRTGGYGLKLSADGFQINNLTEPCAVSFGDQPIPVTSMGRPAGSPRYKLEAPICPMVFDVLNGAIMVSEPAQPCMIEAAGCRVDMRGIWGPNSASLPGQARDIERARTQAERSVRENYRLLIARAERNDQRLIAREQAGFSSEREVACREFSREATHGFCAAKFTEARATELRRRITGKDEPAEAPKPRPRPRPPVAPAQAAPPPSIQ